MTLTNIRFPEDNPFSRIKLRHIFGWYCLLGTGIYFQLAMIGYTRGIQFDGKTPFDLLVVAIFGTYLTILLLALVGRECRLAGIEIKYLVGKVPTHYPWLPLVGLALANVVFSLSVFRVFYYPLSFIVPSFVEKILIDNRDTSTSILITPSNTFFPALYYLSSAIYSYVIFPIFYAFIFEAILLHRWAAKWGNTRAIIAFFLLPLISYNFISSVIATIINAILYVKSRSLLVLIIFMALKKLIWGIWNVSYTTFLDNQVGSTLDVFRSQIQLNVLFFALSAPWVIGFIYKNWSVLKGPLPYFANAAEAEKIKADSAT
ncbi:hypothetical protein [Microcoleus vaginatus]|uniref:hypothetical protein n=1 Tax=Microcoleus vaginatus TaxID=119532 RepID=UPI001F60C4F8|nr:hypothetical protein D0A37_16210 [Microcoleus vaginatus HSN003]